MSVKVRYIYSACVMISTPDVRVLCDPWVTQGIHDGSWFHFPFFDDLFERIGETDLLYVSHIHQDHYDIKFLRQYLKFYPDTKVIIGDYQDNFLARKMKIDGIPHQVVTSFSVGDTEIAIFPNHAHQRDIDSTIAVKHGGHSVLNLNDNLFNPEHVQRMKAFCPEPTIALMPYTGAGSYPHTFYDLGPKLEDRATWKTGIGLDRYREHKQAFKPQATIPFAGQFVLGGSLHYLNPYRGNPDPISLTEWDKDVILLDDGADATVDTADLQPSRLRTKPHDPIELRRRLLSLAHRPMDFELTFGHLDVSNVPFNRLLAKAQQTAHAKAEADFDYWYCIWLGDHWYALNANKTVNQHGPRQSVDDLEHRSEIFIDLRYLYGLLTLTYHWNNAEGGSQYFTRRAIDEYHREVNDYLNFLHI